jgi:hypothetical protein
MQSTKEINIKEINIWIASQFHDCEIGSASPRRFITET